MEIKIYSAAVKMIGIFCLLLTSQLSFAEIKVDPENNHYINEFSLNSGEAKYLWVTCAIHDSGDDARNGGLFVIAGVTGGQVKVLVDWQSLEEPVPVWGNEICKENTPRSLYILAFNSGNEKADFAIIGASYGATFFIESY